MNLRKTIDSIPQRPLRLELTTTFGDVTLHVPRLKGVSFETAIIERYRRRESSVEEDVSGQCCRVLGGRYH